VLPQAHWQLKYGAPIVILWGWDIDCRHYVVLPQ
jgi:hypothetical protein